MIATLVSVVVSDTATFSIAVFVVVSVFVSVVGMILVDISDNSFVVVITTGIILVVQTIGLEILVDVSG